MSTGRFVAGISLLWLAGIPVAAQQKKAEPWVAVKSPHFTVFSNAGENQARKIADEMEQFRAAFKKVYTSARVDPGQPLVIFLLRDENSMKALLPEYWEDKKNAKPGGLFLPREEKNYIILRLNPGSDRPYHTVYHEYVHLIMRLNYRSLPVWLNEGVAEFWGNATLRGRLVFLGDPDESYILLLRETKLLPLETLLTADHHSSFYREENKKTVSYAQSWALVHFFLVSDQVRQQKLLGKFIEKIAGGMTDIEAARETFGDLKKLEKTLEAYMRQFSFNHLELKAPEDLDEKTYIARPVPPAESAALRGEFHAQMNRPKEARALLEEALRLDPNSATAHEAMGLLAMRERDAEEALDHYNKAVELGSKNFLVHYYVAMMDTLAGADFSSPHWREEKQKRLRQVIELNPEFAPAYSMLAMLLMGEEGKQDEALQLAGTALQLEPGQMAYRLNYGQVLLAAGKIPEAKQLAAQMTAESRSEQDTMMARRFLDMVSQFESMAASGAKIRFGVGPPGRKLESPREVTEVRPSPDPPKSAEGDGTSNTITIPVTTDASKSTGITATNPSAVKTLAPISSVGQIVEAEGTIASVTCTAGAALELKLDFGGIAITLKAADYKKIEIAGTTWRPPPGFSPCKNLTKLPAKILYRTAKDTTYAGDIERIEVLK